MNAIAIAISSYSVVRYVYYGASSRRDRELKYSSQPIAKIFGHDFVHNSADNIVLLLLCVVGRSFGPSALMGS